MPFYDYQCQTCEETFEFFHNISKKHEDKCEKCGGDLVRLIGSGTVFIFKGSGFYTTDYKKSHTPDS
jgi:putative FmdB family regulatory protein